MESIRTPPHQGGSSSWGCRILRFSTPGCGGVVWSYALTCFRPSGTVLRFWDGSGRDNADFRRDNSALCRPKGVSSATGVGKRWCKFASGRWMGRNSMIKIYFRHKPEFIAWKNEEVETLPRCVTLIWHLYNWNKSSHCFLIPKIVSKTSTIGKDSKKPPTRLYNRAKNLTLQNFTKQFLWRILAHQCSKNLPSFFGNFMPRTLKLDFDILN